MARINEILHLAQQKEERAKRENEERLLREQERRKIIADGLESILDSVVRPVLDGCVDTVVAAGYHAEVVESRKTDPRIKDSLPRLIALQLKLAPCKNSSHLTHILDFSGDFSEEAMVTAVADSKGPAVKQRPLLFSQVTESLVSEKLERFLESAFNVKLA